MQTSFRNVNFFSQAGVRVALHTGLSDYSCLCYALLTVALNQKQFSTFFTATHYSNLL